MHEIRRLLRRAAWRMALTEFCRALIVAMAGGLSALIALRLVQQLWPIQQELPWVQIAMGTVAGALVLALGWTIFTRAKPADGRPARGRGGATEGIDQHGDVLLGLAGAVGRGS